MNENIGEKGGRRDRQRCFKIKKKQLEKLKKEQELDKEIKKIDRKTFLKIIPIMILGESLRILFPQKKKKRKEENAKKIVIEEPKEKRIKEKTEEKIEQKKKEKEVEKKQIKIQTPSKVEPKVYRKKKTKEEKENTKLRISLLPASFLYHIKKENHIKKEIQKEKHNELPKETPIPEKGKEENKTYKEKKSSTSWEKITDIKLIEEYEKRLKDLRYELRNLSYEYNNIETEKDSAKNSQEIEQLIYRLNLVIEKLTELREKIKIEDISKYDDNYLYQLVNEYMKEFDDRKWISQIKDSDLYILISEKLQEMDQEKEDLKKELLEKQEKQNENERKLQEMKRTYDDYQQINADLMSFQNHQAKIISELEHNIENSMKTYEKVQTQIIELDNQSKRLLELIAIQMMIPKLKSAKTIISATIIYMHFMRRFLAPNVKTKKYQLIQVDDYSKGIENSLYEIDKTTLNLKNTSQKLKEMIKNFENEYKEYIDTMPECKDLLHNLQKVQNSLLEKEYELAKLKQKQEKNLEINNEKVKKWNNKTEDLS